jgi:hypothetical protein
MKCLLLAVLILMTVKPLWGQYAVQVVMERTEFFANEVMSATVNITNRSGAEVVVGGPGRTNWLQILIEDDFGKTPLPPLDVDGTKMMRIPAGATISQKLNLTQAYALADVGTYAAVARVYYAPTNSYYDSNRKVFTVVDNKPIWTQSYGVPKGYMREGMVMCYNLHVYRDYDRAFLYFTLCDEKLKIRSVSYRLDPILTTRDPQIALDKNNWLHVFFQATTEVFTYCIIKPDGMIHSRKHIHSAQGVPQLLAKEDGTLTVVGGTVESEPGSGGAKKKRGVSDRPPGL